jgi:hypothetical protein
MLMARVPRRVNSEQSAAGDWLSALRVAAFIHHIALANTDTACIWLLVGARRVSWLVRNTPQDVGRIERFPRGPSILTLGSKSPRDKAVAE